MARPTAPASKRRTIGENPLDALLPPPHSKAAAESTATVEAPPVRRRVQKVRGDFPPPLGLG